MRISDALLRVFRLHLLHFKYLRMPTVLKQPVWHTAEGSFDQTPQLSLKAIFSVCSWQSDRLRTSSGIECPLFQCFGLHSALLTRIMVLTGESQTTTICRQLPQEGRMPHSSKPWTRVASSRSIDLIHSLSGPILSPTIFMSTLSSLFNFLQQAKQKGKNRNFLGKRLCSGNSQPAIVQTDCAPFCIHLVVRPNKSCLSTINNLEHTLRAAVEPKYRNRPHSSIAQLAIMPKMFSRR